MVIHLVICEATKGFDVEISKAFFDLEDANKFCDKINKAGFQHFVKSISIEGDPKEAKYRNKYHSLLKELKTLVESGGC